MAARSWRHGLTALPAPGHTPGHYAFTWRNVALIGDAALAGPDGELLPFTPTKMMTDPEQSDETRAMLSALPAAASCPGTPSPSSGDTTDSTRCPRHAGSDVSADGYMTAIEPPFHRPVDGHVAEFQRL